MPHPLSTRREFLRWTAEAAAKRPGVRRTDACTVACDVKRQCDVLKWLSGTGID